MNNIKTIVLLCFIYCITTVHLMENSAVLVVTNTPEVDELKTDIPDVEMVTETLEVDELEINELKTDEFEMNETVNLKNDAITEKVELNINTSEKDDIEKWSNSLKPETVVDWSFLCPNLSGSYYRDYLKKVLAITRCPPHIVNNLAEKYIESNWPPGISNVWEREFSKRFMNRYNCRRLPATTISKEVLVVLASDNKMMTEFLIDELGFVMFFGKGGTADKNEAVEIATDTPEVDKMEIDQSKIDETVHIMNNAIIETDEIKNWSNSLKPVEVVDWLRLYTNLSDFFYKDYLEKVLALTGCPTHIINNLAEKYTESNWPPGILTSLERKFSKEIMSSYTCRRLPGTTISKEVVVVLGSDNKTMPEDMIDGLGFIMFFSKEGTRAKEDIVVETGSDTLNVNELEIDETVRFRDDEILEIDTSGLSEIKKWSNSLKPAKVIYWGNLYTNFSNRERLTAELLIINGCPTHIVNDLAEKYNDSHWPPVLSTYLDRTKNKHYIDSYNCRRLRVVSHAREAVIVLACDNKTMPKEMMDEIGFVMFFKEGGTEDIEDIV